MKKCIKHLHYFVLAMVIQTLISSGLPLKQITTNSFLSPKSILSTARDSAKASAVKLPASEPLPDPEETLEDPNLKVINEAKAENRLFELPISVDLIKAFKEKGDDPEYIQSQINVYSATYLAALDDALVKFKLREAAFYIHKYLSNENDSTADRVHSHLLENLEYRRLYLIQEKAFQRELFESEFSRSMHVTTNADDSAVSNFYIGLNLIRVLTKTVGHNDDSKRVSFCRLLNFYEGAVEAGFSFLETNINNHSADLLLLNDEVSKLDEEITPFAVEPEKPQDKFTEKKAEIFYQRLTERQEHNLYEFNDKANYEALLDLEKLAHQYRYHNDAQSLEKIIEILVAASGHRSHSVRNKANLLLDRIFAPKPFYVPQQKTYENYAVGESRVIKIPKAALSSKPTLHLFSINKGKPIGIKAAMHEEKLEPEEEEENWIFEINFKKYGHFDSAVSFLGNDGQEWFLQNEKYNVRYNIKKSLKGTFVYEIFVPVHGHARQYRYDSKYKGILINEYGEVVKESTFEDITAHLKRLKKDFNITHLYLLGALEPGSYETDWAPEATSSSPFSPESLTHIAEKFGGEKKVMELVEEAEKLQIKVGIDIVPHFGKKSLPADWRNNLLAIKYVNDRGFLTLLSGNDGRYEPWNDSYLLNWRSLANWKKLADGIIAQMRMGFKFYRGDIWHTLPIMLKTDNRQYLDETKRSPQEILAGSLVDPTIQDGMFQNHGYWETESSNQIPPPLLYYISLRIQQEVGKQGWNDFMQLAECYWGREKQLAMLGIVPYDLGTRKILEEIASGKTTSHALYNYHNYLRNTLPKGSQVAKLLGAHDEERILQAFGDKVIPFLVYMTLNPNLILDYEGNAEGELWKIFVDNYFRNWTDFTIRRNQKYLSAFKHWYEKHRKETGKDYLIWANHGYGAAKLKELNKKGTYEIYGFNFSPAPETINLSLQFDDPELPIADGKLYEISDPEFSAYTGKKDYLTGAELRKHRMQINVSAYERLKLLQLTEIKASRENKRELLAQSFQRLLYHDSNDTAFFENNYFIGELKNRLQGHKRAQTSFLKALHIAVDRYGVSEEQLFLGIKRGLYFASRDSLDLKIKVYEFMDFLQRKKADDFPYKKLFEYLEKAFQIKDVVFVSTEAQPFSTSGGMGTVLGALPQSLAKLGVNVYVITPKYHSFTNDESAFHRMNNAVRQYNMRWQENVKVKIRGDQEHIIGIHQGKKVNGVNYILLSNNELLDGLYYGVLSQERIDRRIIFSRGAIEAMKALELDPTWIVANDAATGHLPIIIDKDPYIDPTWKSKTVYIAHNHGIKYQDRMPRYENGQDNLDAYNLDKNVLEGVLQAGENTINVMDGALKTVSKVIGVSSATASDIERFWGRKTTAIFNAIPAHYYEKTWEHVKSKQAENGMLTARHTKLKKAINKNTVLRKKIEERFPDLLKSTKELLKILGNDTPEIRYLRKMWVKLTIQLTQDFKIDPDIPLLTMIHRVTDQKGFHLLEQAQEQLFSGKEVQLVVGGPVDESDPDNKWLKDKLHEMARRYPKQCVFKGGFLDLRFYTFGSDIFLMPSLEEPGGICNQEAAALGNMVVARATGGLQDRVIPIQKKNGKYEGNGWLFRDPTSTAFAEALDIVLGYYRNNYDKGRIEMREWAIQNVQNWDDIARQYASTICTDQEIVLRPNPAEEKFYKAADIIKLVRRAA